MKYDDDTFSAVFDSVTFTISIDDEDLELCEGGSTRLLTK